MNGSMGAIDAGKPASFVAVDGNGKVVPSDTGVATPSKQNCAHAELATPNSYADVCIRAQHTVPAAPKR